MGPAQGKSTRVGQRPDVWRVLPYGLLADREDVDGGRSRSMGRPEQANGRKHPASGATRSRPPRARSCAMPAISSPAAAVARPGRSMRDCELSGALIYGETNMDIGMLLKTLRAIRSEER